MVYFQEHHGTGGCSSGALKQVSRRQCVRNSTENEMMQGINALVDGDGEGDVKAFVLMTLRPNNVVKVSISNAIQEAVRQSIEPWARSYLARAYESSGIVEQDHMGQEDDAMSVIDDPPPVCKRHPSPRREPQDAMQGQDREELVELARLKPHAWEIDTAFRIDDKRSVTMTMLTCLWYVQQVTLKSIAKNWIKGICPRKQTKYPYRNRKREMQGREPELPPWWPTKEICMFREPDHVDSSHRLAFHVFVLRLRPTVEELLGWNKDDGKQKAMRTHEEYRWTEFLRELAPLSVTEEDRSADDAKTAHRKKLLEHLYKVASLEEQYENGDIDGSLLVQPLGADLQKKIIRTTSVKRNRQSSTEASVTESDANDSEEVEAPVPTKKAKTVKSAAKANDSTRVVKKPSQPKRKPPTADEAPKPRKSQVFEDMDSKPRQQIPWPNMHRATAVKASRRSSTFDATTPSAITTSLPSEMSDVSSCDMPVFTPASPFPEMGYQQHGVQCHPVYGVPQPAFHTTPNTPNFDFMPVDQPSPAIGHDMAVLSLGQSATEPPQGMPTFMPHPVHGLPTTHATQQHQGLWAAGTPMQPLTYEVQQGVPSEYAQHAGFVGTPNPQAGPSLATNFFSPSPRFHGEHNMDLDALVFGPNHDLPPTSLPASVIRGFTGHASGVGDSACPPGAEAFGYDFTT